MGLFSSKKRVQVASASIRLLDDKDFRYSSQLAINDWIFKASDNLVQSMIDHANGALPRKMRRAYNLASKPDKYVFGLPKDSVLSQPKEDVINVLKNYLNQIENQDVEIIYSYVNTKLYHHELWLKLIQDYQYNPTTNQLIVDNQIAYLKNAVIYLSERTLNEYAEVDGLITGLGFDSGKSFGRNQNLSKTEILITQGESDYAEVYFTYRKDIPNPDYKPVIDATIDNLENVNYEFEFITVEHTDTIKVDLSYINPELLDGNVILNDFDYVQSAYKVGDEIKFFTYQFGSGGIYEIDSAIIAGNALGNFFPRIYTRINYNDLVKTKDEAWKSSIKKMFRVMDLDLKKITEQINKSIGGDLGDTVYIYFDMSVAINKDRWEQSTGEYLFKYFDRLYDECSPYVEYITDTTGKKIETQHPTLRNGITQVITDNVSQQSLSFKTINKKNVKGVAVHDVDSKALGVGEYTVKHTKTTNKSSKLMQRIGSILHGDVHQIIHQISETTYEMIEISALMNSHSITDRTHNVYSFDENLTIPLDRDLIQSLNTREKEKLMYKCLHVQVGIRKVTKVKWYQRGVFKLVMAVVGIAIAYFTAGAGTPFSQILMQAGVNAVTGLAISYGLDLVLKVAVKLGINPKMLGIITFVASIAAIARGGIGNFSFKATDIMKALNKSFEMHNKMIALQIQKVQKEMVALAKDFKTQSEQLKRKQEMYLSNVIPLDLELLASPVSSEIFSNLGSTVEAFYNNNQVDVKDITLNVAHNYVAMNKQLPNYDTTLKQIKQQQQKREEVFDIQSILIV